MAIFVEGRKKVGGTFSDVTNDNLMLYKSHIQQVIGLLDASGKLDLGIIPTSLLNTKKLISILNNDTNFAALLVSMDAYLTNDDVDDYTLLRGGSYFIANGTITINASTDHVIQFNDLNEDSPNSVILDHGDTLYYIKYGSTTEWISETEGSDIDPSSVTIERHFATIDEARDYQAASAGLYILVTGYEWVEVNQSIYDAADTKYQATLSIGGNVTKYDAAQGKAPIAAFYSESEVTCLDLNDDGIGHSYWQLIEVVPGGVPDGNGDSFTVYQSIGYSNKHIWGVINNREGLATTETAGYMSAADKEKINGIEHGANKILFASTAEAQTGTEDTKALTSKTVKASIDYNQDLSYFESLTDANNETLPNGSIAIIKTGTVTV